MTQLATRGIGSCFGQGSWTVQVAARGGSPVSFEPEFANLSFSKVLNASGDGRIDVPGDLMGSCCEMLRSVEPYKDELVAYRDGDLAYVGPVTGLSVGASAQVGSADLFSWFDLRFLEQDFHADGDVASIFRAVFDVAYALDTSPNIAISTRDTGVDAVREFRGVEFRRAADVMRELARTGLDFTMDGRRLLAGGAEVFLDAQPLILHDEGVVSATVSRDASAFATDVAVFGATAETGGVPVTGRATRSQGRYGLVQRSFTELLIEDDTSADANALARLEAMQPAPLRVRAVLSPEAAFGFGDLIPGRRVDVRLFAVTCIEVGQMMRLQQVNVSVGETEEVSVDLIPIGVSGA